MWRTGVKTTTDLTEPADTPICGYGASAYQPAQQQLHTSGNKLVLQLESQLLHAKH
jgi:hypothetical protein